ncbi:MAG: hypothetical protein ABIP51_17160 [Bacteroidia bacterium]
MKDLNKEVKKEIVSYCEDLMTKLNSNYLKTNNIYKNEFLEFLYLTCIESWKKNGEYILSEEMITMLFTFKKNNELYMTQIRNKEVEIKGIDKNENLIIDENEIFNRTKDEGTED